MIKEYEGTPYTLRVTVKCSMCEVEMYSESKKPLEDRVVHTTIEFMRNDLQRRLSKGHSDGKHKRS